MFRLLFRSRWMALLWAAGVVWMAMDVAGSGASDPGDAAAANAMLAASAALD